MCLTWSAGLLLHLTMMGPSPGPVPGTLGPVVGEPQDSPAFIMAPRKSMTVSTKGLLNMPGQNNCFLNSAVQVRNLHILCFNIEMCCPWIELLPPPFFLFRLQLLLNIKLFRNRKLKWHDAGTVLINFCFYL